MTFEVVLVLSCFAGVSWAMEVAEGHVGGNSRALCQASLYRLPWVLSRGAWEEIPVLRFLKYGNIWQEMGLKHAL